MHIILYQPKIPQNTGNVVRTCAVTGSSLILVAPLGFKTTDSDLKRAGLDYWEGVNVRIIEEEQFGELIEKNATNCFFFSSKGSIRYNEVSYPKEAYLIFGSETEGLPNFYRQRWPSNFVTIPMVAGKRCLNLATSVGIALYRAKEQHNFT